MGADVAAPDFVTSDLADQPRRGLPLPPARKFRNDRPAALAPASQPFGGQFGTPGPDQGFGLKLAKVFTDRLVLAENEHTEDAVAGCVNVGLARAALFGRAPVIHDMTVAYTIWGFLGEAPSELVDMRRPLFMAASHHYWDQREIVARTPPETLRLVHAEVERRFPSDWKGLLGVS
jgi:hypothetical protein